MRHFLFHNYRVRSSFSSLRLAILLIAGEISIGAIGYMIIQKVSLLDALYMTIITISTVGYGEVTELHEGGKTFSMLLILANFIIFAYVLYTATYYIFEGKLFLRMHENFIQSKINQLDNHVILCGYGRHGREVGAHFLGTQEGFVVIENNPETIKSIQESKAKVLYVEGDATNDETLIKAGIKKAKAVIVSLPDDSDNVYTVLTARQLNGTIDIISRALDKRAKAKIELAGANHVILPHQIGGFYMATLIKKPNAVEFFSYISTEYDRDMGMTEIHYDNIPQRWKGKSISELNIRVNSGANIIGLKKADGSFVINPSPDTILEPESSFILLGDEHQLEKLEAGLAKK